MKDRDHRDRDRDCDDDSLTRVLAFTPPSVLHAHARRPPSSDDEATRFDASVVVRTAPIVPIAKLAPIASTITHAAPRQRRVLLIMGLATLFAVGATAVGLVVQVRSHRASSTTFSPPFNGADPPPPPLAASTPPPRDDDSKVAVEPAEVVVHPAPSASSSLRAPSNDAGASLERAAADAARRGDLRAAVELYERLAVEQPNNPAFSQTAQILRKRLEETRPAP